MSDPVLTEIFFFSLLGFGRENTRTSKQLYAQYKISGGKLSLSVFRREIRDISSRLRAKGIKVIGDGSGYYLASNKREWEAYKSIQKKHIQSIVEAIAKCEKKSQGRLIKEWFLSKKQNNDQLSLINDELTLNFK